MSEVEDREFYQDVNSELDHIAQHLSEWLKIKLLRASGKNWWKSNVYRILDDNSQHRIDSGQWKVIEDLDLHALLKVFDRNFNFLYKKASLPRDSRQIIKDMINVRSRCHGHRPVRGNKLLDLERDIDTMRRFCELIAVKGNCPLKLQELYNEVCKARLGNSGVISATITASTSQKPVDEVIEAGDIDAILVSGKPKDRKSPLWGDAPAGQGFEGVFHGKELTESQAQAVEQLNDFLNDRDQRCFVLKGYAGTGKTFVIGGLVEYLRQRHVETVVMAPTGRAANVIASRHQISAGTIHRTIYAMDKLEEYREVDEDGSLTFKFYYGLINNDAQHDTVFIVDEASMLSDVYSEMEFIRFGSGRLLRDLLEYINFDANDYSKKIIFVGDSAQLPPVGMKNSPALTPKYLEEQCRLEAREFEMVNVLRQAGESLILRNATAMRNMLAKNEFPEFEFQADDRSVLEVSPENFITQYVTFCGGAPKAGSVILGYSNRLVTDYNAAVRRHFYPGKDTISIGDRVIVVRNNYRYEIALYNGQFGTVVEVGSDVEQRQVPINVGLGDDGTRRIEHISLSFRDMAIEFFDMLGRVHQVQCKIIEDLLDGAQAELSSEQTKALYVDFKTRHPKLSPKDPLFKNALVSDPYFNALQIKYGYAVTCHKAQGGEWDTVFIDFQLQNKLNAGALRWSYTALTRAENKVVATNALHHDSITLPVHPTIPVPTPADPPPAPVNQAVMNEEELPHQMEGASPMAQQLYSVVKTCLGDEWNISDIKHRNYFEQYKLEHDGQTCLLKLSYNGQNIISNIRLENCSNEAIGSEAEGLLEAAKGTSIRSVQATSEAEVASSSIKLNHAHFANFCDQILPLYKNSGVQLIEAREHTEYQMELILIHNGRYSRVVYYFDGKRRFKHIEKHPDACANTIRIINEIHSGKTDGGS